jgi:hypothetical protein
VLAEPIRPPPNNSTTAQYKQYFAYLSRSPLDPYRDKTADRLQQMDVRCVISTGTPPGVGMGVKPSPVFLKPGQTIRLGIDGRGEPRQTTYAAG